MAPRSRAPSTPAARPGQQLLYGAYQALERQIAAGNVEQHARTEMLDLIVVDGRARGIVARDLVTGEISTHFADAVVLATGGYGNVFYLSTNAKGSNATAIWRAHKQGALLRQPLLHADPPDLHPGQGRLPVQAHADERVAAQRRPRVGAQGARRHPRPAGDPRGRARLLPRAHLPRVRQPGAPRHRLARRRRTSATRAAASAPAGSASTWTSPRRSQRLGRPAVEAKYGNLFDMYAQITGEDPYAVPMRIYPAVHYTMGGLWVDYDLQSSIPGMFVIGEANFSDHGANRLGASALMQGLADGYFVLPATITEYLADAPVRQDRRQPPGRRRGAAEASSTQVQKLLSINGTRTPASFHRELGQLMWDLCGMERSEESLRKALDRIPEIRQEFWTNLKVSGDGHSFNQTLEHAGRVADFIELAELMCIDALHRSESCGGHFRAESQTPEGEALRDDENFAYVAAWEWTPENEPPVLHREALEYEYVHLAQRSYK